MGLANLANWVFGGVIILVFITAGGAGVWNAIEDGEDPTLSVNQVLKLCGGCHGILDQLGPDVVRFRSSELTTFRIPDRYPTRGTLVYEGSDGNQTLLGVAERGSSFTGIYFIFRIVE